MAWLAWPVPTALTEEAQVNRVKITHDVPGIRYSTWSLIAVGHNLHGQKDGTWEAKVMTRMA